MLATPGTLPAGTDYSLEVKGAGMRMLADAADGRRRLAARSGREAPALFPELAGLTRLAPDVLLDGEVVLLDGGVPSFTALGDRMHEPVDPHGAQARPVTYMVFDVLRLYGVALLERPLDERRATLERLDLDSVSTLSLPRTYVAGAARPGPPRQRGMAGVVAKRRTAQYRPGARGPDWISVEHRPTRACLVGGWRPERDRIATLLLGLPVGEGLRFVGTVDATRAGATVQRVLHGRLLPAAASPFVEGLSRAAAAGARWCRPSTVVDVVHLGWDGSRLREPGLRGLRDDLSPADLRAG